MNCATESCIKTSQTLIEPSGVDVDRLMLMAQLSGDDWHQVPVSKLSQALLQEIYDRKVFCSSPSVVVGRIQTLMIESGIPAEEIDLYVDPGDDRFDWDLFVNEEDREDLD